MGMGKLRDRCSCWGGEGRWKSRFDPVQGVNPWIWYLFNLWWHHSLLLLRYSRLVSFQFQFCREKKFCFYLIVLHWCALGTKQASLDGPWFVFWQDTVEQKLPIVRPNDAEITQKGTYKGTVSYLPHPNSTKYQPISSQWLNIARHLDRYQFFL